MIAKPLLAAVTAVATLALGATTAIAPTAHALFRIQCVAVCHGDPLFNLSQKYAVWVAL